MEERICSFTGILSQCRDVRTGVIDVIRFAGSGEARARVLELLESFYLRMWKIIVQ